MTVVQWQYSNKETGELVMEQLALEGRTEGLLTLRESMSEILLRALRRLERDSGQPQSAFFSYRDEGVKGLTK